jgi:hypothetical protein
MSSSSFGVPEGVGCLGYKLYIYNGALNLNKNVICLSRGI